MATHAPEPDSTGSSRLEENLTTENEKNGASSRRLQRAFDPSAACSRGPRSQSLWVVLIVLLGLLLRLTGLWWGQAYFYFGQGDGVAAYAVAVDYAQGEAKAQYIGQPNYNEHSKLPGPLWTLFCLAGLRLCGSITGVILLTILLNTVAIWLTYRLAEATLGPPASLWAALFAATTPSAVFYSVGVYNPEVMPLLGGCFYLALWKVISNERSRHIFWVGLLLLMMPQFHMSGLALWPVTVLVLALAAVRVNGPWLVAGLLAGLLLYVPYILGDMAAGWQNTVGMLKGGKGFTWDSLKTLTTPFNLLINWVPQWTRSAAEYRELGRACFGFFGVFLTCNILSVLVAVLLVAGTFLCIRKAIAGRASVPAISPSHESVEACECVDEKMASPPQPSTPEAEREKGERPGWFRGLRKTFRRAPGPIFLVLMVVCPLFFALISGKPFHARYALVLFPPLLSLAGLGAATVWTCSDSHSPFGRLVKGGVVVSICINIYFLPSFYWHQGNLIEQGNLFVPSFRNLEQAYQHLKTHARNVPIEIDDSAYLQSFTHNDPHRDASLIRRYVTVREMELASHPIGTEIRRFKLIRAEEVQSKSKATAYLDHEIALVPSQTD